MLGQVSKVNASGDYETLRDLLDNEGVAGIICHVFVGSPGSCCATNCNGRSRSYLNAFDGYLPCARCIGSEWLSMSLMPEIRISLTIFPAARFPAVSWVFLRIRVSTIQETTCKGRWTMGRSGWPASSMRLVKVSLGLTVIVVVWDDWGGCTITWRAVSRRVWRLGLWCPDAGRLAVRARGVR